MGRHRWLARTNTRFSPTSSGIFENFIDYWRATDLGSLQKQHSIGAKGKRTTISESFCNDVKGKLLIAPEEIDLKGRSGWRDVAIIGKSYPIVNLWKASDCPAIIEGNPFLWRDTSNISVL
ncbi:MAG: hypothetical protein Q8P51_11675 [Ignavibacteria bacterium]|nr:hypothetical protein [Ignavibacteria bacterium]